MILYLDASVLVRLYFEETGSAEARAATARASAVATCRVAYAEARGAFARKRREGWVTRVEYRCISERFERDWESFLVLDATQDIMRLAGELVEKHPLRALDAIHLASALFLQERAGSPIAFSSADTRLQKAASVEGLRTDAL